MFCIGIFIYNNYDLIVSGFTITIPKKSDFCQEPNRIFSYCKCVGASYNIVVSMASGSPLENQDIFSIDDVSTMTKVMSRILITHTPFMVTKV